MEETVLEWSECVRSFWPSETIPNIKGIFASWVRSVPTFANQTKDGAAPSSSALKPNTPLMLGIPNFKNSLSWNYLSHYT